MVNGNELESGTRPELSKLINFCHQDLEQTLPAVASVLRENDTEQPDIERARSFIEQLPPLVTIPVSNIQEFSGINFDLIKPEVSLRTPYVQGWMQIRKGAVGSEALEDLRTKLSAESANYATAVLKAYKRTKEGGFEGFIDFLDKAGMTDKRIGDLLGSIKGIKDSNSPQVTEAADIRRQNWTEATPLTSVEEMDQAITKYQPQGVRKVTVKWKNPPVPSAFLFTTFTQEGQAQLKGFVVEVPDESEGRKAHELSHVYMACRLFEQGKVPTAVAGVGIQEKYARIIEGVDTGEAMLFASCIDASYRFAKFADEVCSKPKAEEETNEEYNSRLEQDLKQAIDTSVLLEDPLTGLKPISGSEVIPFGARTVPYMLDVVEATALREQLQKQEIHNPDQVFDAVTKA